MEHKLKIKAKYAVAVWSGRKTFEIRKNDRNYKVGDTIVFQIFDGNNTDITEKFGLPKYVISYIFNGGEYGLDKDYCVFSMRPFKE